MGEEQTTEVVVEKSTTVTQTEDATTIVKEAMVEVMQEAAADDEKEEEKLADVWLNGEEHPIRYMFSIILIGLTVVYCIKELIPPGCNILDLLSQ